MVEDADDVSDAVQVSSELGCRLGTELCLVSIGRSEAPGLMRCVHFHF